jgi:NADH-quinone oxidoreductase subunit G
MPDSGRVLYKAVDDDSRMTVHTIEGRPVNPEEAFAEAARLLKAGKVGIVGSGRSSVEEQYLLQRVKTSLGEETRSWLVARIGEGDGKLLSADRNPNVRGALLTGLIDTYPETELSELARAIEAGEVDTILSVGEDLTVAGLDEALLAKVNLIYMGTHHCGCSQTARVEIPILTTFEKSGTFVNQQFRLQKFALAVPGPSGVLSGIEAFSQLLDSVSESSPGLASVATVWGVMAKDVAEFKDIEFAAIPATGTVLDGSRFSEIQFVEGSGLHFEPAKAVEEVS